MIRKQVRSKVTLDGELMFPNDYLAAVEFKGRDVTLTISAVSKEALQMMDGGKKNKLVLRFDKTAKKLVCNKTNADSIAQVHGAKAEKWVGQRVTLYPTRCLAFGEMVDCIRVREQAPGPNHEDAPPPKEPDAFDDNPTGAAPPAAQDPTPAGAQPSDLARDRLDQLCVIASDASGGVVTAKAVIQWLRSKWPNRVPEEVLTEAGTFEQLMVPLARKRWAAAAEPIEAG